jgi:hypothetical protein
MGCILCKTVHTTLCKIRESVNLERLKYFNHKDNISTEMDIVKVDSVIVKVEEQVKIPKTMDVSVTIKPSESDKHVEVSVTKDVIVHENEISEYEMVN